VFAAINADRGSASGAHHDECGRHRERHASDMQAGKRTQPHRGTLIENGGAMAADDSAAAPAEPELKDGSMATGAGFRAVVTRGDSVVWSCNHVHFTDHSAKADAQAHLATMQPDEASAVASVAAPTP
jgi:hypothetical protein